MEARSVYLILRVREGAFNISKAFRENQFNNIYKTNVLSAKTSREFIDNRISSPSRTRSSRDPYPRSQSNLNFDFTISLLRVIVLPYLLCILTLNFKVEEDAMLTPLSIKQLSWAASIIGEGRLSERSV